MNRSILSHLRPSRRAFTLENISRKDRGADKWKMPSVLQCLDDIWNMKWSIPHSSFPHFTAAELEVGTRRAASRTCAYIYDSLCVLKPTVASSRAPDLSVKFICPSWGLRVWMCMFLSDWQCFHPGSTDICSQLPQTPFILNSTTAFNSHFLKYYALMPSLHK